MSRKGEKVKSIIPYQKEISFGSKIAEITSMSLEHEIEIKQGEASGNFILSGDYKSHEVSVNREPFLYKLPFSIELTDQIDLDSIQFEITDFSYDLLNDDTVEVNIEFSLEAEEILIEEPEVIEESVIEVVEERNIPIIEEDPVVAPDLMQFVDANVIEREEQKNMEVLEEEPEKEEERIIIKKEPVLITEEKKTMEKENMQVSEETIIKNVNPTDDSFATYHIHIVKEGENVETICTMYQSNINLLTDYNDMSNIMVGDKIIIPKEDE